MLGPNGLQSHRICKRFYIARRAKVRPVGLYKAKSSTGVSLLTICISLYKAFSSFVYSCYCIALSRRYLLLKKKMAVGGCFCGKVRIEYSGQPIATVSVPIYNPWDKFTASCFSFDLKKWVYFSFQTGTLPLSGLPQTHGFSLHVRFHHQNHRPESHRKS